MRPTDESSNQSKDWNETNRQVISACKYQIPEGRDGTNIAEFGGESPSAHSSGIGLHHAIHPGDVTRGNPQPRTDRPRSAIR